jgi:hypothetical protein
VHRAKGHIRPVGSIEPRKIIDLNRLEQLEEAVKELEDAVAVLAQISDIDESVPFDAVIEQIAVLRRLGYPEDADRADPEPSPAPEQRASADWLNPTTLGISFWAGHCWPLNQEVSLLLIIAIVLLLLFAGLGFVAHVLWLGLILAVIVGVAHALTSGRRA